MAQVPKDLRQRILKALNEAYPNRIMKKDLLNSLDDSVSVKQFMREIRYLEERYLIDVEWLLEENFKAKINAVQRARYIY